MSSNNNSMTTTGSKRQRPLVINPYTKKRRATTTTTTQNNNTTTTTRNNATTTTCKQISSEPSSYPQMPPIDLSEGTSYRTNDDVDVGSSNNDSFSKETPNDDGGGKRSFVTSDTTTATTTTIVPKNMPPPLNPYLRRIPGTLTEFEPKKEEEIEERTSTGDGGGGHSSMMYHLHRTRTALNPYLRRNNIINNNNINKSNDDGDNEPIHRCGSVAVTSNSRSSSNLLSPRKQMESPPPPPSTTESTSTPNCNPTASIASLGNGSCNPYSTSTSELSVENLPPPFPLRQSTTTIRNNLEYSRKQRLAPPMQYRSAIVNPYAKMTTAPSPGGGSTTTTQLPPHDGGGMTNSSHSSSVRKTHFDNEEQHEEHVGEDAMMTPGNTTVIPSGGDDDDEPVEYNSKLLESTEFVHHEKTKNVKLIQASRTLRTIVNPYAKGVVTSSMRDDTTPPTIGENKTTKQKTYTQRLQTQQQPHVSSQKIGRSSITPLKSDSTNDYKSVVREFSSSHSSSTTTQQQPLQQPCGVVNPKSTNYTNRYVDQSKREGSRGNDIGQKGFRISIGTEGDSTEMNLANSIRTIVNPYTKVSSSIGRGSAQIVQKEKEKRSSSPHRQPSHHYSQLGVSPPRTSQQQPINEYKSTSRALPASSMQHQQQTTGEYYPKVVNKPSTQYCNQPKIIESSLLLTSPEGTTLDASKSNVSVDPEKLMNRPTSPAFTSYGKDIRRLEGPDKDSTIEEEFSYKGVKRAERNNATNEDTPAGNTILASTQLAQCESSSSQNHLVVCDGPKTIRTTANPYANAQIVENVVRKRSSPHCESQHCSQICIPQKQELAEGYRALPALSTQQLQRAGFSLKLTHDTNIIVDQPKTSEGLSLSPSQKGLVLDGSESNVNIDPKQQSNPPGLPSSSHGKDIKCLTGHERDMDNDEGVPNMMVNKVDLFDHPDGDIPAENELVVSTDRVQCETIRFPNHQFVDNDSNIATSSQAIMNPYTKMTPLASFSSTGKVKDTSQEKPSKTNTPQQECESKDQLNCDDRGLPISVQQIDTCQSTKKQLPNNFVSNNVEPTLSIVQQHSPCNKENNELNIFPKNIVNSLPTSSSCGKGSKSELEGCRGKLSQEISHDCLLPTSKGYDSKESGPIPDKNRSNNKTSNSNGKDRGNRHHNSSAKVKKNLPPLPRDLVYDEERLQPIDDKHRQRLIKEAELNATLKNGWKILPHQKAGILCSLLMRRLVLAFDMGLGKTLIGCVWAKAFKKTFTNMKVYIVCPVSLKKEWSRTAAEATGLRSEEEKKRKKDKKVSDAPESLDISICSWAKVPKVPTSIEKYIVIGDEAHNMQSMESARTKDMLKLVLSERCKGVLLLTGTPMKNGKPANLFPLLRAIGHPFGDDQMSYEMYFCNGQQKRFGPGGRLVWDASGSSNLDLLNAHISSHVFHKTKDDCLKELPKKTREYRSVPVSSRHELKHTNAMRELANVVHSMIDKDNDSNDALLGAFARVRQASSFAKVDATVALAKCILEKEASVVIFTFFVSIAKEVHKKLTESGWSGELLTGETATSKRQDMVENFQAGVSPVFVATFGAGGVGITLTAACTVILLDRPWTPGDALQAEDRVRRIGQTRQVKSIWMRAFQVDEQIDNLIEQKGHNSTAVVDSRRDSCLNNLDKNKSASAPKVSLHQLVQSIVTNNATHN